MFCKLCKKDFSCAHCSQYDCQKHIKSQFYKNIAERASASGNVRGFFIEKQQQQNGLKTKWQVMAADVKMCEMIAELNLPLATADSVTNIFDR